MAVTLSSRSSVHGYVAPGFETVRDTFVENFERRGETGGACAAYLGGAKVVDLWGGVRDAATGALWEQETMVIVYSATKGLAAMTMAVAHSRRWLDYEERVAVYWPEFARNGKAAITVRQLLAHQAGLYALDRHVDRDLLRDLDRLAAVLAEQRPAWPPGSRQAYHGITLGYYENEIMRRVDPQHRSIGLVFQDEIATPLNIEAYIRLPEEIPTARLAPIVHPGTSDLLRGFPFRLAIDALNPRSKIARALQGSELPIDPERVYARDLEIASGGGVATARGIARAYGVFATGGSELRLRPETLRLLAAPAVPSAHGFHDECLHGEVCFALGFMRPSPAFPFGGPLAYGAPGAGGAMGMADPEIGLGYAYVTGRMGTSLHGDARDVALRDAIYAAATRRPSAAG